MKAKMALYEKIMFLNSVSIFISFLLVPWLYHNKLQTVTGSQGHWVGTPWWQTFHAEFL
jgi:hypothetical protein